MTLINLIKKVKIRFDLLNAIEKEPLNEQILKLGVFLLRTGSFS